MQETLIQAGISKIQAMKDKYFWLYIPKIVVQNLDIKKGDIFKVYFDISKKQLIFELQK